MKICKIIDEANEKELIGYLFYHEIDSTFSIELSKKLTSERASIFFAPLIERGELTVNPKWSEWWVNQRIVPSNRQNLGQILRDNKLKEYDRYKLLLLGNGRCAQDDYAVIPIKEIDLPEWVRERRGKRIEFCSKIDGKGCFVIFENGEIRLLDLDKFFEDEKTGIDGSIKVISSGEEVQVGKSIRVSAKEVYEKAVPLPITRDDFKKIIGEYVVDTKDVCDELGYSRQYVHQLSRSGEITSFKEESKTALYTKSDIAKLKDK